MYNHRFSVRLIILFILVLFGSVQGQAQLKISEERILLDLYGTRSVDTIVEKGKYQLAISHEIDICFLSLKKNGRRIRHLKMQDNKPNSLYRGVRTRLLKPRLRFRRSTEYLIRIRLEGEQNDRVFKIKSRHPDTPIPLKNEIGKPVLSQKQ